MSQPIEKKIYVFADWIKDQPAQLMGTLYAERTRGKEIFSFEYATSWLQSAAASVLDPELQLFTGRQYTDNTQKSNFGLFLDSSPDRWGRVLMQRRAYSLHTNIQLLESDYLLGVHDTTRMGAIRFKTDLNGDFLDNNANQPTPPIAKIRELEQASLAFEKGVQQDDPKLSRWLNLLVTPGSSLGGARPKANVLNTDNSLWIAKFPSLNDNIDIGLWEYISYKLALKAGIRMAKSAIRKFSGKHHTFLTQRFDRREDLSRIHFASAMTLLAHTDGDDYSTGVSYLDLVAFISQQGASVNEDLEELFRRIVFSICIKNTDDHLRNHGFLLTPKGWRLSPAYDINPNHYGTGLKLNISEDNNALSLDLILAQADYFRLKPTQAKALVHQIVGAVRSWNTYASNYKIPSLEQSYMAPAFELSET